MFCNRNNDNLKYKYSTFYKLFACLVWYSRVHFILWMSLTRWQLWDFFHVRINISYVFNKKKNRKSALNNTNKTIRCQNVYIIVVTIKIKLDSGNKLSLNVFEYNGNYLIFSKWGKSMLTVIKTTHTTWEIYINQC